jgi:predicted lipoprotein
MSRLSAALPRLGSDRPGGAGSRRRQGIAAAIVVVIVFLIVDPQWVVQDIKPPGAGSTVASSTNLDPTDYVSKYWEAKILPTVTRTAVNLPTLLAALKKDKAATTKRYGNIATFGGQPTFLVKGTARVVSVDTSGIPSQAGLALGRATAPAAFMQLGPILTGTDVRDAMKFISFNQFADQVTYSEVATAINKRIVTTTLDKLDNNALKGKRVTFTGAFTLGPGKPLITPITVKVRP